MVSSITKLFSCKINNKNASLLVKDAFGAGFVNPHGNRRVYSYTDQLIYEKNVGLLRLISATVYNLSIFARRFKQPFPSFAFL
jgi:hypothetical protein